MSNTIQITFDANDIDRMAEFWADGLGYVLQPPPDGFDSWEAFWISAGFPRVSRGDSQRLLIRRRLGRAGIALDDQPVTFAVTQVGE